MKKEILLLKGKENLKTNIGDNQRLSIVDKGKEHNTRNEIASDLGWSTGKVAMADVQGRRCQMLPSYDPEKPLKKPSIRAN